MGKNTSFLKLACYSLTGRLHETKWWLSITVLGYSITKSALLSIKIISICFWIKAPDAVLSVLLATSAVYIAAVCLWNTWAWSKAAPAYAWFGIPHRGCASRELAACHSFWTPYPLPGLAPAPGVRSGSLALLQDFSFRKGVPGYPFKLYISALHCSTIGTITVI